MFVPEKEFKQDGKEFKHKGLKGSVQEENMFAFSTWRSCQEQPVPSVKAGLVVLRTTRSQATEH